MLAGLHKDLMAVGIQLQLVEAHTPVHDLLHAEGLDECLGQISCRLSVDDIIETFRNHTEPRT
jgi:sulfate permease, SulP family